MAFEDDELSINDGAPIELFEFVTPTATYRYTTFPTSVVSNLNTFTPLEGLKRDAVKVGTHEDDSITIDVAMPFNDPMVVAFVYDTAPPTLTLNLYRAHASDLDDRVLLWTGPVTGFSVQGRTAKMRVPSLFSFILNGVVPAPRYQAPCNHVLYDTRCGVTAASHQHATTVTGIASNVVTLATQTITDADLIGGEMVFSANSERRMITSVTGLDVTVAYPFATLVVGSSVTIRKGCDHSFATCKSKFSNGINFGGMPLVPPRNPFTSKL